jgi:hypothetical protein
MSDFVDKLKLKEAAEEDLYFAKRDVELIEALHRKKLAKLVKCPDRDERGAKGFERRFRSITKKNERKPRRLARCLRALLDEIIDKCKRR